MSLVSIQVSGELGETRGAFTVIASLPRVFNTYISSLLSTLSSLSWESSSNLVFVVLEKEVESGHVRTLVVVFENIEI